MNGTQEPEAPRDDLRRRAFSALASTSVVVVVDRTVQILLMAVVARLVTPEQTAVATSVSLMLSTMALLASWGVTSALVQMPKVSPEMQSAARTLLLASSLAAVVLLEMAAPMAGSWFHNPAVVPALRLAAIVLLAQSMSLVAQAHILRNLRAQDIAVAEMAASLASAVFVTIPLAVMHFGFWSLIGGMMAQTVLRAGLLTWYARQPLHLSGDIAECVNLVRRGFGYLLSGFLKSSGQDAPRWLVGHYLRVADLAVYSRASALMVYPSSLFVSVVERVVFPAVGIVQSDTKRLGKGIVEAVQLTALVGLPLTVALFILGGDVITVMLGPRWSHAIEPFRILSLAVYFRIADRLNWVILRGMGRPYLLSIFQLLDLVLLLAACAVGARAGLEGVAAAVVCVTTFSFFLTGGAAMILARVEPVSLLVAYGPPLACACLAAALLGPLSMATHAAGLPSLAILGLSCIASGVAAVLATWLAPGIFLGAAGQRLRRLVIDQIMAAWNRRRARAE